MTFEEFFSKKKIDLVLLEKTEPALYAEFKSHFALMGEKSFDHSKKFWFNRLRHLYHLPTPAKQVTQLETQIASQAEPLSSPTMEQTVAGVSGSQPDRLNSPAPESANNEIPNPVNKPRFKPRTLQAKKDGDTEPSETPVESAPTQEPVVVKKAPFRPRNVKPVSEQPSEDTQRTESRPGQTETLETPATGSQSAENEPVKPPAYKPRFTSRNVPKKPSETLEQIADATEEKFFPEDTKKPVPEEESPKKPAYKPRFNAKSIAKATSNDDSSEKVEEKEDREVPPVQPSSTAEPATQQEAPAQEEEIKAKPAYKPRFNVRNIQPKKED